MTKLSPSDFASSVSEFRTANATCRHVSDGQIDKLAQLTKGTVSREDLEEAQQLLTALCAPAPDGFDALLFPKAAQEPAEDGYRLAVSNVAWKIQERIDDLDDRVADRREFKEAALIGAGGVGIAAAAAAVSPIAFATVGVGALLVSGISVIARLISAPRLL
jgi:hypothetical protein